MFGYVTPVKEKLRKQDFVLYRAFYCGICVALKDYGSLPRFTTSYDVTFLALLVHDLKKQEVEFYEGGCVGNPFQKKLMIRSNPTLERVCAANIIMSWYKLCDDVTDGGGIKKRLARTALRKAYKKAKELLPEADEAFRTGYNRLRDMERANETAIDKVADCFAVMLRELCMAIVGEADESFRGLCYNIGKFVYLVDALDDIDDDFKSGNYNPFLACYGNYESRKQFYEVNERDIIFALSSTVNRATECFNQMSFTQSYTLLKNIVYDGLREKTKELLASEKKLARPRI